MEKCIVTIKAEQGLHARPAGQLAKKAANFACQINLQRLDTQKTVNAKSALSILTGQFSHGCQAELTCSGPDEIEALEAIRLFIDQLTEKEDI